MRRLKGYVVGGVLGLGLVAGLYALLWATGHVVVAVGDGGMAGGDAGLGPVGADRHFAAVLQVRSARRCTLLTRLRALCAGTGLTVEGVYRLHLSEETRKANAALAGLGKTRRVLLGDTLLDSFTPEEIEVVFAHEVGHHVHRHLVKMIAYRVVLSLIGFWLVDLVLRRAGTGPWLPGIRRSGRTAVGAVGADAVRPDPEPARQCSESILRSAVRHLCLAQDGPCGGLSLGVRETGSHEQVGPRSASGRRLALLRSPADPRSGWRWRDQLSH